MVGKVKALTLLLAAISPSWVAAHDLPISNMTMVADEDFLHVELVMNSAELVFFRELDSDNNGRLEPSELQEHGEEIAGRIFDCLTIEVDGQPQEADSYGIVPELDTHHLTVRAHYAVNACEAPLLVALRLSSITNSAHTTQVTFRSPRVKQSARLNARSPQVLFNSSHGSDQSGAELPSAVKPSDTTLIGWLLAGLSIGVATAIACFLFFKMRTVRQKHDLSVI